MACPLLASGTWVRSGSPRLLVAQAMLAHTWRGNVRAVETRDVALPADEIGVDALMLRTRTDGGATRLEEMTLEQVERYLIERALTAQGGHVSEAARVLGLSRSTLYRRLASLGVRGS